MGTAEPRSALRKEILPFAATWMNRRGLTLSDTASHREEEHMIPLAAKKARSTGAERRVGSYRGWAGGQRLANGDKAAARWGEHGWGSKVHMGAGD